MYISIWPIIVSPIEGQKEAIGCMWVGVSVSRVSVVNLDSHMGSFINKASHGQFGENICLVCACLVAPLFSKALNPLMLQTTSSTSKTL